MKQKYRCMVQEQIQSDKKYYVEPQSYQYLFWQEQNVNDVKNN